jgi:putative hydrolase of the HAD superfamily
MTVEIRNKQAFQDKPAAVIFDTDNTLYDYAPANEAATAAVEEKARSLLGVSNSEFSIAFLEARQEIKGRLGNTASSHSRLLYFQRTVELLGINTQVMVILDLEQTYWRTFLATSILFPGVKDFVLDLRRENIPTTVVTDLTAQIQFRKLVYFGLDDVFDFVVTSEESGVDKPDPTSFNLVVEKLGVAGEKTWMIGDDPNKDILGARNGIGSATMQKRHRGVKILEGESGPDLIFDHFSELRDFVKGGFP